MDENRRCGDSRSVARPGYGHSGRPRRNLAAVLGVLLGAGATVGCGERDVSSDAHAAPSDSPPRAVSALGRIEPLQGIIEVSASSVPGATSGVLLAQLMVEIGDDVEVGQLLAVTDTADMLFAKVEEIRTELTLVQQQAVAARSSADAVCVRAGVMQREADRLARLRAQNLASEEEIDQARGAAEAGAADCEAANSDARVAEFGIDVANARMRRQKTEWERSQIRAPTAGRILAINARPGEMIGPEGILEMGRVERMYAIAEVYETDVGRVRVGQKATVSSLALPAEMVGYVERVRPLVRKHDEIGTDPAARKDARIVEVEVLLEDPESAAGLTNLQVDVIFAP